jgi:hypothetical protein
MAAFSLMAVSLAIAGVGSKRPSRHPVWSLHGGHVYVGRQPFGNRKKGKKVRESRAFLAGFISKRRRTNVRAAGHRVVRGAVRTRNAHCTCVSLAYPATDAIGCSRSISTKLAAGGGENLRDGRCHVFWQLPGTYVRLARMKMDLNPAS